MPRDRREEVMEATTAPARTGSRTGARLVAEFLARRGVGRIYGLCGGHVQPIWDEAARAGIRVVDVRHECAAVYMAHAEADLTGSLGVAMVTAGPGLTNAITGIANASVSRSPSSSSRGGRRVRRPGWGRFRTSRRGS
ncbi:thiamine pyrophosphate-binding protein [Rubrobacter marinus]|uniref:thiamine pyrophosphate-binding protein n=1 Tax=Rubrobacter marinus TaxID=2653852 RepID=UPI002B1BD534|nr:thiamine pyrophosphate-binding protein [Rubrobacter marinus]